MLEQIRSVYPANPIAALWQDRATPLPVLNTKELPAQKTFKGATPDKFSIDSPTKYNPSISVNQTPAILKGNFKEIPKTHIARATQMFPAEIVAVGLPLAPLAAPNIPALTEAVAALSQWDPSHSLIALALTTAHAFLVYGLGGMHYPNPQNTAITSLWHMVLNHTHATNLLYTAIGQVAAIAFDQEKFTLAATMSLLTMVSMIFTDISILDKWGQIRARNSEIELFTYMAQRKQQNLERMVELITQATVDNETYREQVPENTVIKLRKAIDDLDPIRKRYEKAVQGLRESANRQGVAKAHTELKESLIAFYVAVAEIKTIASDKHSDVRFQFTHPNFFSSEYTTGRLYEDLHHLKLVSQKKKGRNPTSSET